MNSGSWWCDCAWVDGSVASSVRVTAEDGLITGVERGAEARDGDQRLSGMVFPGFANAHSHAFHRALRGRTHGGGGTFWTWRDVMYRAAAALSPESYRDLARGVFAEMALAGVTSVGEFHYVHHSPSGAPYNNPLAMAEALHEAAHQAGLRLTLLDTCYLSGGLTPAGHIPLTAQQRRFSDSTVDQWAQRTQGLRDVPGVGPGAMRAGAAIHSVRAVAAADFATVASVRPDAPVHAHVSEQPAENQACLLHYGLTPVQLLHEHGVLGDRFTAVHATHLQVGDITLLGSSGSGVCACPTTERDLADGIGPMGAVTDAGAVLSLGSDQHTVIDMFAEAQAVEAHERLSTEERGHFSAAALLAAMTTDGHRALGWEGAGRLAVGAPADLVEVDPESARTAGSDGAQIVYSATTSDVRTVVCGGKTTVSDGHHVLGDVGRQLHASIDALLST